jgi:hypothetical protein
MCHLLCNMSPLTNVTVSSSSLWYPSLEPWNSSVIIISTFVLSLHLHFYKLASVPDDGQSPKNPISLCVIHHRQNPIVSTCFCCIEIIFLLCDVTLFIHHQFKIKSYLHCCFRNLYLCRASLFMFVRNLQNLTALYDLIPHAASSSVRK